LSTPLSIVVLTLLSSLFHITSIIKSDLTKYKLSRFRFFVRPPKGRDHLLSVPGSCRLPKTAYVSTSPLKPDLKIPLLQGRYGYHQPRMCAGIFANLHAFLPRFPLSLCRLEYRTLWQYAVLQVTPQGNQQLPRQGNDANSTHTLASLAKPSLKPLTERTVWLVT